MIAICKPLVSTGLYHLEYQARIEQGIFVGHEGVQRNQGCLSMETEISWDLLSYIWTPTLESGAFDISNSLGFSPKQFNIRKEVLTFVGRKKLSHIAEKIVKFLDHIGILNNSVFEYFWFR